MKNHPKRSVKAIKILKSDRCVSDNLSEFTSILISPNEKPSIFQKGTRYNSPYDIIHQSQHLPEAKIIRSTSLTSKPNAPKNVPNAKKESEHMDFIIKMSKGPSASKIASYSSETNSPILSTSPLKKTISSNFRITTFNVRPQHNQANDVQKPGGNHRPKNTLSGVSSIPLPHRSNFKQESTLEQASNLRYEEQEGHPPLSKNNQGYKIKWFDNYFIAVNQQLTFGKLLGEGAFAQVYEAFDIQLGYNVAVKIFDKKKLVESTKRKEVQNEIDFLQRLDHPGIVKLLRVVEDQNRVLLVLHHCGKRTLKDYVSDLDKTSLGSVSTLISILKQVASAVWYLHQHNICHRDIKLANIMVRDDKAFLIDFGMACDTTAWKEYLFCGTANYLSPEMVGRSGYQGPPNDVWAFGVVVYRSLSSIYPFGGILSMMFRFEKRERNEHEHL